MNVLLDTHAFIWWDEDPAKLGLAARTACFDPDNVLILSAVSVWEIQLKQMLGKLSLRKPLRQMLGDQMQQNGLQICPIATEPILQLSTFPFHHRDPFDRLLISQAKTEGWTIATHDRAFGEYEIPIIWA